MSIWYSARRLVQTVAALIARAARELNRALTEAERDADAHESVFQPRDH